MQKALLLFLLTTFLASSTARAQPAQVLASASFKRAMQAYADTNAILLGKELPALEKAFGGNAYVRLLRMRHNQLVGIMGGDALREYSEIIKLAPDIADAYVYRSDLFADKGMYDRAVADMDKAISLNGAKTVAGWYKMRGDYRAFAGDNTGAMADFQEAIKKAPALVPPYRGLANTARAAGKPEVAAAAFTSALTGGQSGNGGLHASYGEFLLNAGKFAEADAQYKKAFAQKGFKPNAKDYNAAGTAAYKLKKLPEAAALFEQAMAYDTRFIEPVFNRASVCIDQQDWEGVYKYAQQALAIDDQNPMANMYMAVGIKRTNRGDARAAEYETRAKRLDRK